MTKRRGLVACAAVVVLVIAAVCFLAGSQGESVNPFGSRYTIGEIVYYRDIFSQSSHKKYMLKENQSLYVSDADRQTWECVGAFVEMELDKSCFDEYFRDSDEGTAWKTDDTAQKLRRENASAWKCVLESGTSYYLLCQKNGDVLLVALFYDMEQEQDEFSDDSNIFYILSLKRTPELSCTVICDDTQTQLAPEFYPDGTAYDETELSVGEIVWDGQLIFTPGWDADSLTVTEEYRTWDGTDFVTLETKSYTLSKAADGTFVLPVANISDVSCEAYYRIEGEGGSYVMKVVFPEIEDSVIKTEMDATKIMQLDEAITAAFMSSHAELAASKDHIVVESHVLLGYEIMNTDGQSMELTLYLVVMQTKIINVSYHSAYQIKELGIFPTVITFTVGEDGEYLLKEYWEPGESEFDPGEVRERFPDALEADALDIEQHEEILAHESRKKQSEWIRGDEYLKNEGEVEKLAEVRIALCLEVLASSPLNAESQIAVLSEEYEELIGYNERTLRYCFARFMEGGQDERTEALMIAVCCEITEKLGEPLADAQATGGQRWFDAVKANALQLSEQHSCRELSEQYPVSWLLLKILGET